MHMEDPPKPKRRKSGRPNPNSPSYRRVGGKRAVVKVDKEGQVVEKWPSIATAAKRLDMKVDRLRYLCSLSAKTGSGKYFYEDKLE